MSLLQSYDICISLYDNVQNGMDLRRPLFVELFYEILRSEFWELFLRSQYTQFQCILMLLPLQQDNPCFLASVVN
jgi:hypothetical protein